MPRPEPGKIVNVVVAPDLWAGNDVQVKGWGKEWWIIMREAVPPAETDFAREQFLMEQAGVFWHEFGHAVGGLPHTKERGVMTDPPTKFTFSPEQQEKLWDNVMKARK